jgi:hypothetical protein
MIGIGCTTYNRPDCLQLFKEQILKHTNMENVKLHIAIDSDSDRKGVAYRKNECLRNLKECEYVFLFDDDCFPIKDNWTDFFINSNQEHLLFLSKNLHSYKETAKNIEFYNNCGGVFLFMKKSAIDRVGAFDEGFGLYGFEHLDYSDRIIGKRGEYPMLIGTENYLYALDYSNPNHKSSINSNQRNDVVSKNLQKYNNYSISQYIPL